MIYYHDVYIKVFRVETVRKICDFAALSLPLPIKSYI